MDNDTTAFPMIAAVRPGNSGGPGLDGSGAPLGVTVARMNDVATLVAAASVPQIAAGGKAFTAQIMCVRVGGQD